MPVRLTLRTLLAYLDDSLEPAQAKQIGQKIAESDGARDLIERIKDVTRRRRLTTPPASGPGSRIDPNTIAEYLDNEISPEQAAETEAVFLASDVHLAEVAACHQILTLVLGEPASVPPTAKQRMYGLVKGPESIPFRKPKERKKGEPAAPVETRDPDETLRLGLPPLGKGGRSNRLFLAGGGILAACLLGLVVWQVVRLSGVTEPEGKKPELLAGDPTKKEDTGKETDIKKEPSKKEPEPKTEEKKEPEKKEPEKEPPEKKEPEPKKEEPKETLETFPDVPWAVPGMERKVVGQAQPPEPKDPGLLLQATGEKFWRLLDLKRPEVQTALPLTALPACRRHVDLDRGLRLTLWGNMPEQVPLGLYESSVILHAQDVLHLDLTLRRGRIVLTNRKDKAAFIRLRFENPVGIRGEDFADITLHERDAEIIVDRMTDMGLEPFYPDPKNPNRVGPTASMGFFVVRGTVSLKHGDVTFGLSPPPGACLLFWSSIKGLEGPQSFPEVLPVFQADPPLPEKADPKFRAALAKARDSLAHKLGMQPPDVALTESLKAQGDEALRRLAVRSLAALDDVSRVLEMLDPPSKYPELRQEANLTLQDWIGHGKDYDYRLFDILREKYSNTESQRIMELFHRFSAKQAAMPETYELLIDYLVNPNPIIREMGAWHLYNLVPAGRSIPYSSLADRNLRETSRQAWQRLIPPGRLPPREGAPPIPMK